jgi:hypothetical protein
MIQLHTRTILRIDTGMESDTVWSIITSTGMQNCVNLIKLSLIQFILITEPDAPYSGYLGT